ncbi:TonB-dependent receptor [Maribacter sp. 2210JD10-5]|uniref:TonB-dependent receptor n=1 Tax=Maribacter sp. 2210JD10-5 TaxID=3386272 RepID=UPI0039BD2E8B
MYKSIRIGLLLFVFATYLGMAQETEDIGTETVTVTKAYTPTVSDAFKIKSMPNLNDSIVLQKKKIEYSIFSVPVASTFTPNKGTASRVEKTPPPVLFNSYASAGGGNPANVMAQFYTTREVDRESNYTIGLDHNSSRGNFDDVVYDNTFSNTRLDASFKKRDRDLDWGADIGVQHQLYNWYGTPSGTFDFPPNVLVEIDRKAARQNYFMAEASGHINVEESVFERADLKYRRFWDSEKSGENRAIFNTGLVFPLNEESLGIKLKVDYVSGDFENASLNTVDNVQGIAYSNLLVGVNPRLIMLRDDLSLNLGINVVFGTDLENNDSDFYIYPAVTASYRLLDETVIAYGGIEGELRQNSYYGFVEQNQFVSPTLRIEPTDTQYDAYVGIKGQLLPNLSYNLKGSYMAENRSPLFLLNPTNDSRAANEVYAQGNSFQVFYDDIKTFGLFGELNVDVNRNFTLGINAEVYDYNTETDNPAWNRPNIQGSLFMDYQIGKKWFAGANLFYVGEREDLERTIPTSNDTQITLDGFFDANAHVGHRLNDQFSIFIKAANLANNNYQRWANFQVQGLQVLGGATYKFDF